MTGKGRNEREGVIVVAADHEVVESFTADAEP